MCVCDDDDDELFLQGAKAIMKDVAKYIPGLGWTFLFMEYPTLKRNWKLDKDRIPAQCRQIKDYPVPMMVNPLAH